MRILDLAAVGIVLLASLVYAVYSLGPRTLRSRLLAGASALLLRLPHFFPVRGLAQRLQAASAKGQDSCGGCGSCGSAPSATEASTEGGETREIKVPFSSVGRR